MTSFEKPVLWRVSASGCDAVIWSARYNINESKALSKWRKLSGCKDKKASASMAICSFDSCWNFATELLASGELSGVVPKNLWVVSDVELHPGDKLQVGTVCPMCEKHARRFRRTMQERIFRLEERLDELRCSVKDLEQ